jgi:hypothetical protein
MLPPRGFERYRLLSTFMLLRMAVTVEAQPLIAVRDVRASSRGTEDCLRQTRCLITGTVIYMIGCSRRDA